MLEDQIPDAVGGGGRLIEATPVVFLNGDNEVTAIVDIQGKFERAVEDGRAYSIGSGLRRAENNKSLSVRLTNPANSGKRMYITDRVFSNSRRGSQKMATTEFVVNTNALSGATVVNANNLMPGSDSPSAATLEWTNGTENLGDAVLSRVLPLNGIQDNVTVPRIMLPGTSIGYRIPGIGRGNSAMDASIAFIWIEEDWNE